MKNVLINSFQVQCIKSKVMKKFTTRKLKGSIDNSNNSPTDNKKYDHFEATPDIKLVDAKKKLLKLIHLDDCFEDEKVRASCGLHCFFKKQMGHSRPLFSLLSVFFKQINVKNVHPESGAGIQTHNLLIMSLLL